MRLTRSRRARRAALLAIAVVAGATISSTAQAVSGVSPVPSGTYLFTAKIQSDLGACSAALVDPTWVITTAECLTTPGQPVVAGPPTRPTSVTVGRTDLTATDGHVMTVTSLAPHPSRNVVLAQLDRPATGVTPISLGAPATAGEQLMAAGFGRTATEWVPDKLHAGAFAVTGVAGTSVTVDGGDAATSLCKGDGGGPLVRVGAGAPQLVALHDRSWQGGCLAESETRRTATEVRVDDLGPWIAQNTRNSYVALNPGGALLDTRSGIGGTTGPRTGAVTTDVQALGVGGVPSTGVTAVLIDVTAINPTTAVYLTVFPQGSPRPATSSLNAVPAETISTTQVVKVGPDGRLSVYHQGGSTHVRIDVHGYFTNSGGGGLVAVKHTHMVDTRDGTGTTTGTIPTNGSRTFTLTGGVIPAGATSALVDVVVANAAHGGYLSAYATGGPADPSSMMDYAAGFTSQGLSVKLSAAGQVTFVNRGPAVHLMIRVQGYVAASPTQGADLRVTQPTQVVDTRADGGAPLKAKGELFLNLNTALGIPENAMDGALISVTAVHPTANGFLTVEKDGLFAYTNPGGPVVGNTSVSNFAAGHYARTTMVVTRVGRDIGRPDDGRPGMIRILNASSGTVHVVVTLHGWFNKPAGSTP
ncbi:trypsin-like serine protease [Micromonospora sp. WMMD964]|uniref:S1 family peptidase n=1 Tax=Micromonospora sp. WMMD964 TaxID=3016091 RepID=UPI00249C5B74|nr:trypsin-like serine protease [Micromonospora sp. WMMD964]WFE99468.1 trypsin-like serine protease [Micromonospora sp. WMMD964]